MATDFGQDVSVFYQGTMGLDPTDALISGPRVTLENCAKRLSTRRGLLRHAPNFGYDLMTRVGARVTAVGLARVQAAIREELLKEDGVLSVPTVNITTSGPNAWTVTIRIDLAEGPFLLVLAVTDVSVKVLTAGKA